MLKRVIVTEWNTISSEETSKLVQSMPKRLTEVLRQGELPGGGQEPPTSLPLPPTSREDLQLDSYFKYPHAAKHPCLLRDSNSVPTAQKSASLTIIPNGRLNDIKMLIAVRGSLMAKVADSSPVGHEFEPRAAEDPSSRGAMHVKSVESSNVLPMVRCGS
ncbi:hypothetical protein TNCV_583521 [Trichonephila clavipes]|nr:hypothetical protein TNCV_583521 [Trichonephila clavipes]